MKKTVFKKCIACLLLILVIAAGFAIPSDAYSSQSAKLFSLIASEGGTLQGYIDNVLPADAGTSTGDWMFIALMRHDPSLNGEKFIAKLDEFVASDNAMNNTQKERVAIAYTVAGVRNDFVDSALELDFGATGINGLAFGLILLDCGKYESKSNDRNDLISDILNRQFADNGWALSGSVSDIDITSMVLQSLAPYKSRSDVSEAINKALDMLSKKQTDDGDYKGMGRPPMPTCESTAQVIITLTALGIDPASDSRFIKNGNSVYDGLRRYQIADGSYCHLVNGTRNAIATYQAACALAAAERFAAGKSSFYAFEKRPVAEDTPVTPDKPDNSSEPEPPDKPVQDASSSLPDDASSSSAEDASSSEDSSDASSEESAAYSSEEHSSSSEVASAPAESIDKQNPSGSISYKYFACGGVVLMFIIACIYMRIRQNATLKNIIPIAIGAVMLICGILFFNFTSVKDYYTVNLDSASEGDNTVTISINCKILEDADAEIPEDGYILKPTEYVIQEGDTVFDALLAVTRANQIKISYTGSGGGLISVYVSSIDGLAEMQYGALSGWIYRVNKYTPDVGCGSYDLHDGDVIEWVYTLDLGKDVDRYD